MQTVLVELLISSSVALSPSTTTASAPPTELAGFLSTVVTTVMVLRCWRVSVTLVSMQTVMGMVTRSPVVTVTTRVERLDPLASVPGTILVTV